jgi:hypothetical protein
MTFKTIWFLAVTMWITTGLLAAIAFQHSGRSLVALVHWTVIALSLVASLFVVHTLQAPAPTSGALRTRLVRVVILLYLPLSSALYLLAFPSQ